MSHLTVYSGKLLENATAKTVNITREETTVVKQVLSFKIVSQSQLRRNKPKFFEVSMWYGEDEELKQLPFLSKGKIVSFIGEETAKASMGKNNTLFINYHISALRSSLQFLSPEEKNQEEKTPTDSQEITEEFDTEENFLND